MQQMADTNTLRQMAALIWDTQQQFSRKNIIVVLTVTTFFDLYKNTAKCTKTQFQQNLQQPDCSDLGGQLTASKKQQANHSRNIIQMRSISISNRSRPFAAGKDFTARTVAGLGNRPVAVQAILWNSRDEAGKSFISIGAYKILEDKEKENPLKFWPATKELLENSRSKEAVVVPTQS